MNKLLPIILISIILSGCKHDESEEPIAECTSGCINITDINTHKDYYLPFAIVYNSDSIRKIILNNEELNLRIGESYPITENGFFELILIYKYPSLPNDTILFTTKTEEREYAEWGIKAWIPEPFQLNSLSSEDIETIYPRFYADNIKLPFIFYTTIQGNRSPLYLEAKYNALNTGFYIKQGVGSANIAASDLTENPVFTIGGKTANYNITKKNTPDFILSGDITDNLTIPANSFVRITANLNIKNGAVLTVNEGTLILIDESIDINHSGNIYFKGSLNNPIFVTCSDKNKFWGGFITTNSNANMEGYYTIFCQSGYHASGNYNWGHAQRQALFYTENSTLKLDHCFMLDHIGQIFYPQNSVIELKNILVQRAKTSGQINFSELTVDNSIFTDFPDDSRIYHDEDNDALYLNATNASINNSIFMFAKDDGLDSGGDEGGEILVTNTRFEACFHEGAALSSKNPVVKNHIFKNCVFTNCGQGLELGFSSSNHTVLAEDCVFLDNGIGVRYGDNYNWSNVNGNMNIKNSTCANIDKDVWNMVRMDWSAKINNLTFENTYVSIYCPQYPQLPILQY